MSQRGAALVPCDFQLPQLGAVNVLGNINHADGGRALSISPVASGGLDPSTQQCPSGNPGS